MRYFIFILLPFSMLSQNITGKVYDGETTVKGIDVFNLNKKTRTYTDDHGNFTIAATVGDTLSFHSIFHNKKIVQLNESHFNGTMVFELKKTINRLNEILVQHDIEPKEFDPTKEEVIMEKQFSKDKKRNPHLYVTSSEHGLDLIRAVGLIRKLFKKKKGKNTSITYISHKDLDSLFSNNALLNDKFITHDLAIPKDYKQLFLEYCETKNLDSQLLKNENQIILLDSLISYSKSFLKTIKASKEK